MDKIEDRQEFKIMVQVGKISCNLLHDLISPITSLGLYTENIKDKNLKEIIDPIKESGKNIREFISLIQDAVENPNRYSIINLDKSIKHALSLSRHKIIENNVVVIFINNTNNNLKIKCKKLEIYQIIMNLVGNSIDSFKNTARKSNRINISINKKGNRLDLVVSDNGCGIPKEIRGMIFDKEFTTKENGMGIGLNTVKEIIEKSFGGKINVRSQVNKGTQFNITMYIK